MPRRLQAIVPTSLFCLLVALTYWPAVRGAFFLDDYLFLAMARFIDAPWEVFWRSHIPGNLFYRPLGVLAWWVTHAAFGLRPWAHYLFDLGLHLGVCAALWRLAYVLCGRRDVAGMAALVFALHPIGIGTSAWLSDRFDLLAALFGIAALGRGVEFRRSGATRHAVGALAMIAVALFAKEVALAAAAALAAVWLVPSEVASWRRRAGATGLLVLLCIGWLGARNAILGGSVNTLHEGLPTLLGHVAEGFVRWVTNFADYLVWTSLDRFGIALVVLGLAMVFVVAGYSFATDERMAALLGLATLVVMPGLLQSPVTWTLPWHVVADPNVTVVAGSTRFYYLASAGFAILFAIACAPLVRRRVGAFAIASVLAASACGAHGLVRDFHREIRAQNVLNGALVAAVDALPPAINPCLVFVLDLDSVHPLRFLGDVIVKAASSRDDIARDCLVQSENAPWYHVAKTGVFADRVGPLRPVPIDGVARGPTRVGGVDLLYYNLGEAEQLDPAMGIFLALHDGRFENVTDAVRRGERHVATRCIRPPDQCH